MRWLRGSLAKPRWRITYSSSWSQTLMAIFKKADPTVSCFFYLVLHNNISLLPSVSWFSGWSHRRVRCLHECLAASRWCWITAISKGSSRRWGQCKNYQGSFIFLIVSLLLDCWSVQGIASVCVIWRPDWVTYQFGSEHWTWPALRRVNDRNAFKQSAGTGDDGWSDPNYISERRFVDTERDEGVGGRDVDIKYDCR